MSLATEKTSKESDLRMSDDPFVYSEALIYRFNDTLLLHLYPFKITAALALAFVNWQHVCPHINNRAKWPVSKFYHLIYYVENKRCISLTEYDPFSVEQVTSGKEQTEVLFLYRRF